MSTILFFDDWNLQRRENLARHIGEATLVDEGIFEDPYADTAWGYPRVYQDAESGRWRCYYQGQLADSQLDGRRHHVPLLAESDDGIHWEIPDLSDRVEISDRLCPHQLFGIERFSEWCGVYLDPHATGTDEMYKGLVSEYTDIESGNRSSVVASHDGIHWRYLEGVRYNPFGIDPSAYPFWNPYRQSYVLALREYRGVRRIHVSETKDWRTFSDPEWALQPDALDTPCAEIYGMPVVPYEDMFVGLLWMYHTDPTVVFPKYVMGKIDCQLAYSLNGWHFQRTVREPLIANTAPGEHGSGCLYPSSAIIYGDTIRIYSSTSKGEHRQIRGGPATRQAAIVLHTIRLDGFVYLEPEGGTGELITRRLRWRDAEPELNVSAPHGEVRVQVMDAAGESIDGYRYEDCTPFRGDSTSWVPAWGEGRKLAALRDRLVRLGVRLANGRLYAIRGDFEVHLVGPIS